VPGSARFHGGPTVRRRELGALLLTLRLDRRLTVEQVASGLLCSPSKVSRMETGQRGATPRDIRDQCVEGLVGFLYMDRQRDIARYEQVYDYLHQIALNPQESIELIAKVIARHSCAMIDVVSRSDYPR
jgi:transcriptional regulator with XRE-family HTH domain